MGECWDDSASDQLVDELNALELESELRAGLVSNNLGAKRRYYRWRHEEPSDG